MPEIFAQLAHIEQRTPLEGALSMALDEALLGSVSVPTLRTYRWAETTLSVGCFVSNKDLRNICSSEREIPVVRRWTGGGCVRHEKGVDFSYSLIVPSSIPVARWPPLEVYGWVHGRLARALREEGFVAELVSMKGAASARSRDCFASPVECDVVMDGRKVAGAGQKRTKRGLLHQGNVQGLQLNPGFAGRFASSLAEIVEPMAIDEGVRAAAERLSLEKYTSVEWTHRS